MKVIVAATVLTAGLAVAAPSGAAVLIEAAEVGPDTVFSFSGSFDVTGLTSRVAYNPNEIINPGLGAILFVGDDVDSYPVPSLPSFGPDVTTFGVARGDDDTLKLFSNDRVGFAPGYAGEAISGSLTLSGQSFASLGLISGTFTTTATNGSTITLRIGSEPAVIPVPATLPLLLGGLLGLGLVARRRGS